MTPNSTPSKKKRLLIAGLIFSLPLIAIAIAVVSLLPSSKTPPVIASTSSAFNTKLPDPNLKKGEKNKLEIYMQAQQDSLKRKQEVDHDPLTSKTTVTIPIPATGLKNSVTDPFSRPHSVGPPTMTEIQDPNEKKVNDHLQKLYAALNGTDGMGNPKNIPPSSFPNDHMPDDYRTARLKGIMDNLKSADTGINPQLQQISAVLDKVLAIRNPAKPVEPVTPGNAPVNPLVGTTPVAVDNYQDASVQNGFFGLSDDPDSVTRTTTVIKAVIHANQTIVSGAIVKLRLLQDIYIGTARIPANSFIYGPCSLNGERVNIQLTNAIYDGQIYPVQLKVYDGNDGLEGLFVPGAITRDVVKEGMGQNISGLNVGTFDPSLGAQAASAGIETAKNLLSRKVRLVKATLVVGHLAILKGPDTKH